MDNDTPHITTPPPQQQFSPYTYDDSCSPTTQEPVFDQPQKPKVARYVLGFAKAVGVLAALYCFIIALGLLATGFKIVGGTSAGKFFQQSSVFSNPIAGLMLGVFTTVLLQSSSTSTSIVVALVGAGQLTAQNAVYVIMGANVGTSVTSTLVSFAQVGDRAMFERSFAAATVHDMFNILSVLVFLPFEAATHFLANMCKAIVTKLPETNDPQGNQIDFFNKITDPVVKSIVIYDTKIISKVATNTTSALRRIVKVDVEGHMFYHTTISDTVAGLLVSGLAILLLAFCLVALVKLLASIIQGKMQSWIKKVMNIKCSVSSNRLVNRFLDGCLNYLLLLVGVGLTVMVQSSSITTSTITPLCGLDVITLDKVVPIVLGANIGTTCTALIAAAAQEDKKHAMQVALSHLFFNLFGIVVWYVITPMRRVPTGAARTLGYFVARRRWFGPLYIILVFGVIPGGLFGLSLAGAVAFWAVVIPLLCILLPITLLLMLRSCVPSVMKKCGPLGRNPHWLAVPLHCQTLKEKEAQEKMDTLEWDPDLVPQSNVSTGGDVEGQYGEHSSVTQPHPQTEQPHQAYQQQQGENAESGGIVAHQPVYTNQHIAPPVAAQHQTCGIAGNNEPGNWGTGEDDRAGYQQQQWGNNTGVGGWNHGHMAGY